MGFSITLTIPDEKMQELIDKKIVTLSSDEVREYILRLINKDLEADKNG